MDTLPDFSKSKLEVKFRIEGALKERKKNQHNSLYLLVCMMLLTTASAFLYLSSLFDFDERRGGIDYYAFDVIDSDVIIELPRNFSVRNATEMMIISKGQGSLGNE